MFDVHEFIHFQTTKTFVFTRQWGSKEVCFSVPTAEGFGTESDHADRCPPSVSRQQLMNLAPSKFDTALPICRYLCKASQGSTPAEAISPFGMQASS